MLNYRKHFRFSIVFCFLVWSGLSYGEASSGERSIEVEFAIVGLTPTHVNGLYYDSAGESVPLRLSRAYVTSGYSYVGPSPLVFYRIERNEQGETFKIPVTSVEIQDGWEEVLLFFVRSGTGDDWSYSVFAIDNSESAFPPGSYRLYNMLNEPVRGAIGEGTFQISAHDNILVTPGAERSERLNVVFGRSVEGQWQRDIQTVWFYRPEKRIIGFIHGREGSPGGLGIHMVVQTPERRR